MSSSVTTFLPPAALALALSLGFLGSGLAVMRLPEAPVLPAAQPEVEPPTAPEPSLYLAMRDPIIVAHSDLDGRLRVEMGVSVEAAAEDAARAILRDDFAPVQARLSAVILDLATTIEIDDPGKTNLREALPGAVLADLNDRLEALGHGRPIREVFIVSFASR